MTLSVGCHQLSLSPRKAENLDKVLDLMEESDACIDVFPEYTMGVPESGLTRRYVQLNAEPLTGEFVNKVLEKTSQKRSAVVFTTFLLEGRSVYNAAILAYDGEIKTIYRKIHLFDAFGYRESELFEAGRRLALTRFRAFRVGLAVCFDLRFPELFRALASRGADLFIVPSGWYRGEHKVDQWRILTKARAHENNSYLIGVNQTRPLFIGHSTVVSPMGNTVREVQEEPASFTARLSRQEVEEAKKLLPIISLSRPDVYRKFRPSPDNERL
ncbi:MAG: carbon-nitrogen hydrolase family protein [Candidatus Bathyarchaeota archaeon]|jgi:predicted amidohydrolase|nr:carbon-nitrogen hydrolase family protein [Candidatus Bathyarchaeota archaeon]